MPRHPARVHILLARDADTGIIIRRGPSKSVCTIGWDLRTDRFQTGQWLNARIYERRCDLSPDGRHLLYFALDGKWQGAMGGSWTALSRAPYLKALGLWSNGSGWNGGGLLLSDKIYWLNKFFQHQERQRPRGFREELQPPFAESYGGECPGIYYPRLQRDGWKLAGHAPPRSKDAFTLFEKRLWDGWTLEKTAHATIDHPVGKGCYFDTHRLVRDTGETLDLASWEWADVRGRRVLFVAEGVLFEARLTQAGLKRQRMIRDFNPMTFEPLKAPY
jgi:hypothetical protein